MNLFYFCFYLVVFFRVFPTSSSFSGLFLPFDYVFVCVCGRGWGGLHMSGGQKTLEVHPEARITADCEQVRHGCWEPNAGQVSTPLDRLILPYWLPGLSKSSAVLIVT